MIFFSRKSRTKNIIFPYLSSALFWVVNPTISERDTCMCKLHENLSFVAVKLSQLKLFGTANLEQLVEMVCSKSSNKSCMYGECVHCNDNSVPISSAYNSI